MQSSLNVCVWGPYNNHMELKLLFKLHFSTPGVHAEGWYQKQRSICGYEYTKNSLRQIKTKMAECVRQNFPSVAQKETSRSRRDPEENKKRRSGYWYRIAQEYTWHDTAYLLGHLLNEPFFWIMFIIQVLVRVWTQVRNKLVWR